MYNIGDIHTDNRGTRYYRRVTNKPVLSAVKTRTAFNAADTSPPPPGMLILYFGLVTLGDGTNCELTLSNSRVKPFNCHPHTKPKRYSNIAEPRETAECLIEMSRPRPSHDRCLPPAFWVSFFFICLSVV